MKFRPGAAIAALITAGALTLAGCGSGSGSGASSAAGGTLTIAAVQDINSWDPSQAHFGHHSQYYQAVYDTLIRRTPDDEFEPMLATDWSYSDDNTVLTMTIRDDVTFSDGTALDADAVRINLERFQSENGPDASFLKYVETVEAPDSTTVVLRLSDPDPDLIYALSNSSSYIASPAAIEGGALATDPVGSGPYTLDTTRSVTGSDYVLTARDGYWDPELQKFESVVIKPMTDNTAILNALVSGQVEAGQVLSPRDAERAGAAGLTEHEYSVDWNGLMLFDRDGEIVPALGEVAVRQAINHAVDNEAIVDQVLGGKGTVTNQILPPGVPGYDEDLDDAYPYDPDKARELMAEAGYADGFALTLPTVQGLADPASTAALEQDLKQVGIDLSWENVAINDFIANITSGKYPAVSFKQAQGTAWYSAGIEIAPDAVYNPFGSSDPVVDEYLHTLQFGSDAEQDQAATDLNEYLVEQAWFAPAYRPSHLYYTSDAVDVSPQPRQAVPSIYNFSPVG